MTDDYESRQEQRREERREYERDVAYEVWRAGGDADRINPDRVEDAYYSGAFADQAALSELRAQRPQPAQDEYPEEERP